MTEATLLVNDSVGRHWLVSDGERTEFLSKTRAEILEPEKLTVKVTEVLRVPVITPARQACWLKVPALNLPNNLGEGLAAANESRQICTEMIGKVMDPVLKALGAWKQRELCFFERLLKKLPIYDSLRRLQSDCLFPLIDKCTHSRRQGRHFVEQLSAKNTCVRFAKLHCFLMLLGSDLRRILSNLCSSPGCPVREKRNPYRGRSPCNTHYHGNGSDHSSPYGYGYGCPISDATHADSRKTVLKRHNPSLLEPILP